MKFGGLIYIHLLWIIPALIVFFLYVSKRNRKLLEKWGDSSLVIKLTRELNAFKRKMKVLLLITGTLFILIALLQPQWGYHLQELKRKGIDIIIALDTSRSMLADDAKPNRLNMAKREIKDLLKILPGDRIGLVTFAGTSFLQCPLTLDYGAFKLFLDFADTDTIPQSGTDIGGAINKSLQALDQATKKHQAIILITDGEDHTQLAEKAAEKSKKQGVPIFVIGIGSKEGTPIPITNEPGERKYIKDKHGNIVLSKLNDTVLKKIALTTGGAYITAAGGGMALDKIYRDRIAKMEKRELESSRHKIYKNRYQLPLFIALALLLFEGIIGDKKTQRKNNNI